MLMSNEKKPKKIIIFGASDFAKLMYSYLSWQSNFVICGFCIDDEYVVTENFCGLPIIPFSKVNSVFSTDNHSVIVAIGYSSMRLF